MIKSERLSPWLIVFAGVLWGTMGIFVRHMEAMGFTALQISAIRMTVAAILFLIIRGKGKKEKLEKKDVPLFVLTGVVSIFFMSAFYFISILYSSMATAAILLYTAPFFVLIASALLFKEKVTFLKGIALVIAFGGCVMVTGTGKVSLLGILFGLLSGISYASYSVFGTVLLKKYMPLTVTTICFSFGALASLIACNLPKMVWILAEHASFETFFWCVGLGVITAASPFVLYTVGLQHTPAGKASILAFVEPLTATLLGIILFRESVSFIGVAGIIFIIIAIFLLNQHKK